MSTSAYYSPPPGKLSPPVDLPRGEWEVVNRSVSNRSCQVTTPRGESVDPECRAWGPPPVPPAFSSFPDPRRRHRRPLESVGKTDPKKYEMIDTVDGIAVALDFFGRIHPALIPPKERMDSRENILGPGK